MAEKEPKSLSWDELPDDLWVDIFFYLQRSYLYRRQLKSISLVCKRFLDLSNRTQTYLLLSPEQGKVVPLGSLCRRFALVTSIHFFQPNPNLDASITQLANSNLQLQSLHLFRQTHFPKDAMRLLGRSMSKTLKVLHCEGFKSMVDDDLGIVADFFPYLHELDVRSDLEGGQLTDKGIYMISTKLSSLVSLNISGQHKITHRSIQYLSSNCHLLQSLSAGSNYHGNHFIRLDQFLSFKSLSSLDLKGVNISEDMLVQLSAANWKMLQKLKLNSHRCSDDIDIKGATLCRFLKSCVSLRDLHLWKIPLRDDATAANFAASIPNIESILCYFDFPWPDGDHTITIRPILYNLLKSCPLLTRIDAAYSSIGSAQEWFDIPVLPSMKSLSLIHADDLTDETLALIASTCPMLEILNITYCPKITEDGIEAVQEKCGNIKLLSVDKCGGCPNFMLNKYFSV